MTHTFIHEPKARGGGRKGTLGLNNFHVIQFACTLDVNTTISMVAAHKRVTDKFLIKGSTVSVRKVIIRSLPADDEHAPGPDVKPDKVSGRERVRKIDLLGPRNLLQDGLVAEVVVTGLPLPLVLLLELRRQEVQLLQRGLGLPDLLNVVEAMPEADEVLVEAAGGFEGRYT